MRHWKLSRIDIEGLGKWDSYTNAIAETFERSHTVTAPWAVIRAEDKYRARLAVLQTILGAFEYPHKDSAVTTPPDPQICGTPAIWEPELWDDGT